MDAVKYLKTKARMTDNCDLNCCECLFNRDNNGYDVGCDTFEYKHSAGAVKIVEGWAKKHPAKTYLMDFKEKFPNAMFSTKGYPTIGGITFGGEPVIIQVKSIYGVDKSWDDEMEEN